MDWVETTGHTVEEAKSAALKQLGVDESDAEFEVVTEPRLGLFGRLKEEARVRARIQPRYPRPKADRRDRRRGKVAAEPQEDTAKAADAQEGPRAAPRGRRSSPAQETAPAGPTAPRLQPAGAAERPDTGQGDRPPGRVRPGRGRTVSNTGSPTESELAPTGSLGSVSSISLEEQAGIAKTFLDGLLERLGVKGDVTWSEPDGDVLEIEIAGEGLGTLIGPKGTTLLALQELTRLVLQRQAPSGDCRAMLDINGYRKKRQEALARFVQQVAAEVLAKGSPRALEPMPAADRKVVHDTANAIEGVSTMSEGEEPFRRVVLVPDSAATVADGGTSTGPATVEVPET